MGSKVMIYSEYKYAELVIGGVKSRGNIVPVSEIRSLLGSNGKVGCYRSHFRFTEEYKKYVERTGKVKGFQGSAYTDFLWLDIDRKDPEKSMEENLADAQDDAKIYINRLMLEYNIPPAHLRCFFSGMKGFHIGIPAEVFGLKPSKELPSICKGLIEQIAGDLEHDPGIYDRTRIFRLNNTQHETSKLYKIELDPQDILKLSAAEILSIVKTPRNLERLYDPRDSYGMLTGMIAQPERQESSEPQRTDRWLADLLANGAKAGDRTRSVTRLAGYYYSKHIPEDVALELIASWDKEKNQPPLAGDPDYAPDKIQSTVSNIYKYQAPDEEDPVQEPDARESIVFHDWRSLHAAAPEYVERFAGNRLKFGYPAIDEKSALLGRGEVCIILAYVGVGKTVLAQNIQMSVMENQQVPSILFSLEMNAMMMYFRQLGIYWGMSAQEIMKNFAQGTGDGLRAGMERYDGIEIVDYVPLSVPLITDCIKQHDKDIGLAIVDYVGLLSDTGKDNYERMNNISRDLVLMAKELEIAVIAIYQTNRTGYDGEIRLNMGRDSGEIEANCDMALGLWQDKEWPAERTVKLLKARHGIAGAKQKLCFSGAGPRLYVMDEERSDKDDNTD